MTLTIELPKEIEERLQDEAQRRGMDTPGYALHLIEAGLPKPLTEKQQAAIALLQSWIDEDATDDPEEIQAAEKELEEFKRAINANRAGERPIYP